MRFSSSAVRTRLEAEDGPATFRSFSEEGEGGVYDISPLACSDKAGFSADFEGGNGTAESEREEHSSNPEKLQGRPDCGKFLPVPRKLAALSVLLAPCNTVIMGEILRVHYSGPFWEGVLQQKIMKRSQIKGRASGFEHERICCRSLRQVNNEKSMAAGAVCRDRLGSAITPLTGVPEFWRMKEQRGGPKRPVVLKRVKLPEA